MPSLTEHHSGNVIKMLNIGESGCGKTGALASLATAGYNLHVLDYDNGLDVIANVLRNDTHATQRVRYETLRDTVVAVNGVPALKPPIHAYKDAGKVLAEWGAMDFNAKDVLVLDSLTTFSDAAFNQALVLAGRLNQRPQLQDYGWCADSVKLFIEMITSPDLNCHVIVNTHIRWFSADEESQTQAKGLPNAKGQEISRVVSRYFNTVALTRTQGSGPAAKRIISTKPQGVVEVKTSNPKGVKDSYGLETGMAELFSDILGHGFIPSPSPAQGSAPNASATAQPSTTEG
jgi:hypothetical protein